MNLFPIAPFPDRCLLVPVSSKIYDKRDDFDFDIVNFSFFNHYENTPMQYTRFLKLSKMKIFNRKILIFFLFLLKT